MQVAEPGVGGAMLIVAMLAGASFIVVGALIGVRMLLLARRTRGRPELLLGAGLTSLTVMTLPLITLSMMFHVGSPSFQLGLFALGLAPVVGFAASLYSFTAVVFRPQSRLARGLAPLAALAAALGIVGIVSSRAAAWHADRVVSAHWSVLVMGVFVLGLTWTGIEAARYHRMLRRRVTLGLADPVVSNRFFLWSFGCLGAVAGVLVSAGSLLVGWRVVSHPVPIFGIAFAGFTLSGSWYLAFLPPRAYLQQVRARAAQPTG